MSALCRQTVPPVTTVPYPRRCGSRAAAGVSLGGILKKTKNIRPKKKREKEKRTAHLDVFLRGPHRGQIGPLDQRPPVLQQHNRSGDVNKFKWGAVTFTSFWKLLDCVESRTGHGGGEGRAEPHSPKPAAIGDTECSEIRRAAGVELKGCWVYVSRSAISIEWIVRGIVRQRESFMFSPMRNAPTTFEMP